MQSFGAGVEKSHVENGRILRSKFLSNLLIQFREFFGGLLVEFLQALVLNNYRMVPQRHFHVRKSDMGPIECLVDKIHFLF